ncbi:hypothetical protein CMK14_24920 [Candidatus Poribacteria bacterium]|nr:hypothetical protein [Candidatus Poribacteria bacterium]
MRGEKAKLEVIFSLFSHFPYLTGDKHQPSIIKTYLFSVKNLDHFLEIMNCTNKGVFTTFFLITAYRKAAESHVLNLIQTGFTITSRFLLRIENQISI